MHTDIGLVLLLVAYPAVHDRLRWLLQQLR